MIASNATNKPRPPISVVIPLRNEERTLVDLHRRLRAALPAGAELLFVDDGSDDDSPLELARIVRDDPGARAVRLLRPFGKSQALAAGFRRCRGRFVATIDADLQEDPEEILHLARKLRGWEDAPFERAGARTERGFDLVTGWRRQRRDRWLKVFGSRVFNALVRFFSKVRVRDINCGLKVMRRDVVEAIRMEDGFHRFIPLLAHWKGFRIGEEEVAHRPRQHGRSRYRGERVVHGLIDLFVLLFLDRFEDRPSRLFLGGGALLFLGGFGVSLFIVLLKIVYGTIQSRYPLLTLGALLLVVGAQLVSMGLLAELVARRRDRPIEEVVTEDLEPAAPSPGEGVPALSKPAFGATPRPGATATPERR